MFIQISKCILPFLLELVHALPQYLPTIFHITMIIL